MIDRYSGWHLGYPDPGTAPAPQVAERLPSISIPTLVLLGELDLPDFQAIARRLAREMPQAELRILAGSGHMTNMEAPETFNHLVLGFLQRHGGGAVERDDRQRD